VFEDSDRCYRAVQSKDIRFDGWFFTAVTSTGIYCRPSCPAITPKRANVRFYPTSASAQSAGFRACLRCRPDATPGSPEWNGRADVVARAMKLILDGAVDRDGVSGVAASLGYSERQLHRLLVAELGTGALALARAQRAQTARVLIETTTLPIADIAFAAGFASLRQFNDTIREVFARTPTKLRQSYRDKRETPTGAVSIRLAARDPFACDALFRFLAARAIPDVEEFTDGVYRRSLALSHGNGVVELTEEPGGIRGTFYLRDLRDLTTAVNRCRRLLDLDADPIAIDEAFSNDEVLAAAVKRTPGRRMPGAVDGTELAVRAVIGQQVSVAGARTVAHKLVVAAGEPLENPLGSVTHCFPSASAICEASPSSFAMPTSRRDTVRTLCAAIANGDVRIGPMTDPDELREKLNALRGIGPWTTGYIAMRGLGDPDSFLPTDLGVCHALAQLGQSDDPSTASRLSERWRPWRTYAIAHLWSHLEGEKAA
jgi:AraC family transcriptional regulator of adaptative response / DNA-3-methyladenine glycosylase II